MQGKGKTAANFLKSRPLLEDSKLEVDCLLKLTVNPQEGQAHLC